MIRHRFKRGCLVLTLAVMPAGSWAEQAATKNAPGVGRQQEAPRDYQAWVPGPSSKNFDGDFGTDRDLAEISSVEAQAATVISVDYVCGASGDADWITSSTTPSIVRQCSLTVPGDGLLFLSANGSLFNSNGEFEAQFRIDVDSTAGDADIDRWVNVYNDSGNGTDRSVALSVVRPVGAGNHTIYFLGRRYGGSGLAGVHDATLSAIFTPTAQTCGAAGNLDWATTSGSFQVVRQCTLSVPSDGFVFISADASLRNYDGPYEARFEIDIDSTVGDLDVDRWLNIYNDSVDGSDESVALTVRKPITAGIHTVYFLARREDGPGQVRAQDPTLSATFVPASSSCGAFGNDTWTTDSATHSVIRQCTIEVPHEGPLFIAADGSLFNSSGPYEAQFQIGIDDTTGDIETERWVDIYDDAGDGSDRPVALSVVRNVSAGTHTIYFLGRRTSGSGEVGVYDPTLSVWVTNTLLFSDDFESGDTSAWSRTQP